MLDDTRYTGEWDTTPIINDHLAQIRKSEGSSKHYQRHVSGLESAHSSSAEALLKADNGATLKCEWVERGDKGRGKCTGSDGQQYKLMIPSPD